ncbi:MAG: bacterial transcriptional activator domain-containing protein [Myxococcota bacterium]
MIEDVLLGDLTDAVSRGRLTMAEIAAIRRQELDALFELACERLDTERDEEAAVLLACLVTLYPYEPRYWRGYGIALHRQLDLEGARAAYDAAVSLKPTDDSTRCYRGEVALYQSDFSTARTDLEWVITHGRPALKNRARALLEHLEGKAPKPRPQGPAPVIPSGFTLADATPLPLNDGRFSQPVELKEETTITAVANQLLDREVTKTDRIERVRPMPASDTWTARVARDPKPMERIDTARIIRRSDEDVFEPIRDGDTAVIRRRRDPERLRDRDTDIVTRVRDELERDEPTLPRAENTALVRRSQGLPLGESE